MDCNIEIKHYTDLTIDEFHDIIAIRLAIFSEEQGSAYQDLDGLDKKSFHLLLKNDAGTIIGTSRMIPPKVKYNESSFGRVTLLKKYRMSGIGKKIVANTIHFLIQKYPKSDIKISAMKYLQKFYADFGFMQVGEEYLDCNIPHIDMVLKS